MYCCCCYNIPSLHGIALRFDAYPWISFLASIFFQTKQRTDKKTVILHQAVFYSLWGTHVQHSYSRNLYSHIYMNIICLTQQSMLAYNNHMYWCVQRNLLYVGRKKTYFHRYKYTLDIYLQLSLNDGCPIGKMLLSKLVVISSGCCILYRKLLFFVAHYHRYFSVHQGHSLHSFICNERCEVLLSLTVVVEFDLIQAFTNECGRPFHPSSRIFTYIDA